MPYRNPENRRSTERYPVCVQARIRSLPEQADASPWVEGKVLSISISGIFLAAGALFRPGERVEVELPFPEGAERLEGEVKWATHGEPCGAGVAFTSLAEEIRMRIRDVSASGFWLHPSSPPTEGSEGDEDAGTELDYFDTDPDDLIDNII